MINEFKDFIAKGNVMDMAVGIIIGAAFTAIVTSLVDDLINPIIGLFTGGVDFTNLFWSMGDGEYASLDQAREAGATVFAYGSFFTAVINFLIIAWVVFMLVKMVNRVKALGGQARRRRARGRYRPVRERPSDRHPGRASPARLTLRQHEERLAGSAGLFTSGWPLRARWTRGRGRCRPQHR